MISFSAELVACSRIGHPSVISDSVPWVVACLAGCLYQRPQVWNPRGAVGFCRTQWQCSKVHDNMTTHITTIQSTTFQTVVGVVEAQLRGFGRLSVHLKIDAPTQGRDRSDGRRRRTGVGRNSNNCGVFIYVSIKVYVDGMRSEVGWWKKMKEVRQFETRETVAARSKGLSGMSWSGEDLRRFLATNQSFNH